MVFDEKIKAKIKTVEQTRDASRSTQHPHCMIMRHDHMLDGQIGDFTNTTNHVLCHGRSCLSINDHHRVITDNNTGIRIAISRVGINTFG